MSFYQQAKEACGHGGTVEDLKKAASTATYNFNPFVPDDWEQFAVLAFQSENNTVLDYILRCVSDTLPILTRIRDICTIAQQPQLNELEQHIKQILQDKIRGIAQNYTHGSAAELSNLLGANQNLNVFAAAKAIENLNPYMLKVVLNIIGDNNPLCIVKHYTLHKRLNCTLESYRVQGIATNIDNINKIDAVLKAQFQTSKRTQSYTPKPMKQIGK
jgi:hypothetical protein